MEWSEEDQAAGRPVTVPNDIYQQGCLKDVDAGLEAAKRIGFPVMIKASEGGGGKGIRKSNGPDDFVNFFRQVRRLTNINKKSYYCCGSLCTPSFLMKWTIRSIEAITSTRVSTLLAPDKLM